MFAKYNKIIPGSVDSKYDFKYIAEFNFEIWNEKLRNKNFISINIDKYCEVLCEKHVLYVETGDINLEYLDDLREMINMYDFKHKFFRMSYRSAKDVVAGKIPMENADHVLNILIKSERCFDDMIAHTFNNLKNISIIFVPFRKCRQDRELRCFVFQNKLVAITNQFPDDAWPFHGLEILIIQKIRKFVNHLWETYSPYESAVLDVEIDADFNPILIEFNPYGIKGSTSAILFDWDTDFKILNCKNDFIVLRYSRDKIREITYYEN